MFQEVKGDLIEMALRGEFDVIAHGCNCFNTMGAGLALQMKDTFKCNLFKLEGGSYKGDVNKLGQIDFNHLTLGDDSIFADIAGESNPKLKTLTIVNCYTQYRYGHPGRYGIPLDYDALRLCMRKINHTFEGKHIGLPQIGCHLAGGEWKNVKSILISELVKVNVTIVEYQK